MTVCNAIQNTGTTNVVNVPGGTNQQGIQLIMWPLGPGGPTGTPGGAAPTLNELWYTVNSGMPNQVFIMSNLNGMVMDVRGESTQEGTPVDQFPMKQPPAPNQLWELKYQIPSTYFESQLGNQLVLNIEAEESPNPPRLIVWPLGPGAVATPNECFQLGAEVQGPNTQFFIQATFVDGYGREDGPYTGLIGILVITGSQEVAQGYPCPGDAGYYVFTAPAGSTLTLSQAAQDNAFSFVSVDGDSEALTINSSADSGFIPVSISDGTYLPE